jgi:hypothetical protein
MNGVTQEVAFTWFVVVHRSTQNIYHILRIEAFSSVAWRWGTATINLTPPSLIDLPRHERWTSLKHPNPKKHSCWRLRILRLRGRSASTGKILATACWYFWYRRTCDRKSWKSSDIRGCASILISPKWRICVVELQNTIVTICCTCGEPPLK